MGRFKQAMILLFHKKDEKKVEANKESARVQALNKQIKTLMEINDTLNEQVRIYAKQQRATQKVSMEERMLEMAVNMFAPQPPPINVNSTETQTQIIPGTDKVKSFIDGLPEGVKNAAAKVPFETFSTVAKQKDPSLTDTVIKQAYDYILEKQTEV